MSDCTVPAEDCTNSAQNCISVADSLPGIAESCDSVALGRPATGPGPFRWTKSAERAAVLVSEGNISNGAIAFECKVAIRTVSYWKGKPEFQARVEQLRKLTAGDAMDFSIARKIERVRALDERWAKMHQVISERAADMPDVPGGKSGLLVREIKSIGAGQNSREVEEYKVDTALLKELREHERQAAIEVGQWQEGAAGQPLKPGEQRVSVTYEAIQQIQAADPERWQRIEAAARGIAAEERALPAGRLVVEGGK